MKQFIVDIEDYPTLGIDDQFVYFAIWEKLRAKGVDKPNVNVYVVEER